MNTRSQSRQINKKKRRRIIAASIGAVIALCIITGGIILLPLATGKARGRALIIVPENAGLAQLSDSLRKHLGPDFASRTIRSARLMGGAFHLRPGAYEVKKGWSALTTARAIGRGRKYSVILALNNLRTPEQTARRIASKTSLDANVVLSMLNDPKTTAQYGLTPDNAMALFIADNYEVYWDISTEALLKKIGDRYTEFWNKERRRKAAALGLTPAQVATIASIADEETAKQDEKGRICRLYYNRLKKGMRLQADPTVKYAIGDFSIKRIGGAMLNSRSPYNTYRVKGLPPGPIRITSPATIDAFLDSSPTDDIYMCARSDLSGYHDFTSDYSEHQANARRYQEKLNELDIR